MSRWLTPCKYSVFKGYKEYWDFPNMVESIKSSKMGTFEGHLWLPCYIKCLFYNGFRAKVKWIYEGEDNHN